MHRAEPQGSMSASHSIAPRSFGLAPFRAEGSGFGSGSAHHGRHAAKSARLGALRLLVRLLAGRCAGSLAGTCTEILGPYLANMVVSCHHVPLWTIEALRCLPRDDRARAHYPPPTIPGGNTPNTPIREDSLHLATIDRPDAKLPHGASPRICRCSLTAPERARG